MVVYGGRTREAKAVHGMISPTRSQLALASYHLPLKLNPPRVAVLAIDSECTPLERGPHYLLWLWESTNMTGASRMVRSDMPAKMRTASAPFSSTPWVYRLQMS